MSTACRVLNATLTPEKKPATKIHCTVDIATETLLQMMSSKQTGRKRFTPLNVSACYLETADMVKG